MKVDVAIDNVEHSEHHLASRLRIVAERHAADHDVYHLGHTLALRSLERVERLRPFAEHYGSAVPDMEESAASPGPIDALRHKASELLGREEPAGMLLLRDLTELYITAQQAEIAWVILLQTASAVRDAPLRDTVVSCREDAEKVGKWLRTRIKQTAPQVLAAG